MKKTLHLKTWPILALIALILGEFFVLSAEQKLSFNRDIRPILSENCYFCHGFDKKKRKGKLRLDTFEGATKTEKGMAAIVPGFPDKSLLVERIESHDPDELMPPPDTAYRLSKREKKLLKQWIREGAEYEDHWAYLPLAAKKPTDIDQVLKTELVKRSLKKTEKADPRTLVRRLSYDLKGLPPNSEMVKAFSKDPSSQNYERLVDEFLSSMEHAEHQALKWLDLVRWANTTGMVSDEPFDSEAYRNYVIQSFHENKAFDQFTLEQLAGDLLENPDNTALIASGYNRIVKTNCEAGVIEEEALYDLKGEHVRALGTVWMGLTTGCAECHDHKYDPLSQQDYYNLAAFFDDLVEAGCYTPGDRRIPLHFVHDSDQLQQEDNQLYQTLQNKYRELYNFDQIDPSALKTWQAEKVKALKASGNNIDFVWFPSKLPYANELGGEYELSSVSQKVARKVKAKDKELKQHFAAETLTGFFAKGTLNDKKSKGAYVDLYMNSKNKPEWIAIQSIHGAYGRMGWKTSEKITFIWGENEDVVKGKAELLNSSVVNYMGPMPKSDEWVRMELPSKYFKKAKWHFTGMAWIQQGGEVYWGDSGLTMPPAKVEQFNLGNAGMRMFHERPYHRMDYDKRFSWPANAIKKSESSQTDTEKELLKRTFLEDTHPQKMEVIRDLEHRLSKHRKNSQRVLVSKSGPAKMTRVLPRGDFMDQSGPVATPAIPKYFGELKTSGKRATRLDLAKWLVHKDNPLTARVVVNRLWAQFFGKGFSMTLEDLGSQGEWPSHPQLLDQLAYEFIQSGWNIRAMIKKFVMSDTYQLSSIPHQTQIENDFENRFLSRQNRFRYHAEGIRDSALAISGLLQQTKKLPKDSKFFHQPKAYWELSSKVMYGSRHMLWETSQNNEQYYRSIYGFYKRQNAHPSLLAFDAPTRQECTTHRIVTNTPAQALTLLNDPIYMDAAKSLGRQICNLEMSSAEKIQKMYSIGLQRSATESELQAIQKLIDEQIMHYKNQPELTKTFIDDLDTEKPAECAAWIIAARVMLNLHESITRL